MRSDRRTLFFLSISHTLTKRHTRLLGTCNNFRVSLRVSLRLSSGFPSTRFSSISFFLNYKYPQEEKRGSVRTWPTRSSLSLSLLTNDHVKTEVKAQPVNDIFEFFFSSLLPFYSFFRFHRLLTNEVGPCEIASPQLKTRCSLGSLSMASAGPQLARAFLLSPCVVEQTRVRNVIRLMERAERSQPPLPPPVN